MSRGYRSHRQMAIKTESGLRLFQKRRPGRDELTPRSPHMKNYYPLFLNLNAQPVTVIGGGKIAARKIRSLLKSGANVVN